MPLWSLYALSGVGVLSIALATWPVFAEIVRSARQAVRLCHVYRRLSSTRPFPWTKCFLVSFRGELFGNYYDTVSIGPYKLDRNPSKRITATR